MMAFSRQENSYLRLLYSFEPKSLERKYECYCMTGYKLVGGTFRTDLDKAFSVGDGCEDIDECEVAADNSTGTEVLEANMM